MKKSINKLQDSEQRFEPVLQSEDANLYEENTEQEYLNEVQNEEEPAYKRYQPKDEVESSSFSISLVLSTVFIIAFVFAVLYKFIFPTFDSFEANISNKKIGKSIVASYFNLLQNTKYEEALKLVDAGSNLNVDSLISNLKSEFGTTDIVGCNVIDVIENSDNSMVNTLVTYVDKTGRTLKKDQSFIVKNTPDGWKISLGGLIKRFSLVNTKVNYSNSVTIYLEEMEYCVEGISVKMKVINETYEKYNLNGNAVMLVNGGISYNEKINTVLKSKVKYSHNILFKGSSGTPEKITISFAGNVRGVREIPVVIKR